MASLCISMVPALPWQWISKIKIIYIKISVEQTDPPSGKETTIKFTLLRKILQSVFYLQLWTLILFFDLKLVLNKLNNAYSFQVGEVGSNGGLNECVRRPSVPGAQKHGSSALKIDTAITPLTKVCVCVYV